VIRLQVLSFTAMTKQRTEDVLVVVMIIAWVSMLTMVMISPSELRFPFLPFHPFALALIPY